MPKNRGTSLETLVRHASQKIRDEYRALKEAADFRAARLRELGAEMTRVKAEVDTAARLRQALQVALSGADVTATTKPAPRQTKKAKKRKGSGSKKAQIARRWQGAYIGLLRGVKSESERARVRKIAAKQGVPEAVKYMRAKQGKVTAVPSKPGGQTSENGKKLAVQVDLLKAKSVAGNGSLSDEVYARLAKKHGFKEGQVRSLLATTQGKFRRGFLRRLVAGLSNGEALRKLAEIAPLYGKRKLAELQREAGL